MSRQNYRDYFEQPAEGAHRRYEALRCVFVDEQPMKAVAERFGVGYGTVRNWVSEFQRTRDAGESPPLLLGRCEAARLAIAVRPTKKSRLQM